jgi:hypothetical protein
LQAVRGAAIHGDVVAVHRVTITHLLRVTSEWDA